MSSFSDSLATALHLVVSMDAGLVAIVGRSLAVSASACALACGVGLLLGAWLGVARFALREGGRSPAFVDLARHQTAPERQAGRSRSTPQREVRAKPTAGGGAARGVWQDF
jgi:hypothetical protein